MHSKLRRIEALEHSSIGPQRYYIAYPEEGRFVLPGGRVVDSDTFTQAVERAGNRAVVIRVQYADA